MAGRVQAFPPGNCHAGCVSWLPGLAPSINGRGRAGCALRQGRRTGCGADDLGPLAAHQPEHALGMQNRASGPGDNTAYRTPRSRHAQGAAPRGGEPQRPQQRTHAPRRRQDELRQAAFLCGADVFFSRSIACGLCAPVCTHMRRWRLPSGSLSCGAGEGAAGHKVV